MIQRAGLLAAFLDQFNHLLNLSLEGYPGGIIDALDLLLWFGPHVRIKRLFEPGLAESEFSLVRFHGDRDRADAVYRGTQPLTPADIAEIVHWVTSVPPHVNICSVEVMPVCQGCGPLAVHRQGS